MSDNYKKTRRTNKSSQSGNGPVLIRLTEAIKYGGGVIVIGKIERGSIKIGDQLEFLGRMADILVQCHGIEIDRKIVNSATTGDDVGILMYGVDFLTISNAMKAAFLLTPGAFKFAREAEAKCDFSTPCDSEKFRAKIVWKNVEMPCEIHKQEGSDVRIELICATYIEPGETFELYDGGKKIGSGTFTSVKYL